MTDFPDHVHFIRVQPPTEALRTQLRRKRIELSQCIAMIFDHRNDAPEFAHVLGSSLETWPDLDESPIVNLLVGWFQGAAATIDVSMDQLIEWSRS